MASLDLCYADFGPATSLSRLASVETFNTIIHSSDLLMTGNGLVIMAKDCNT